MFVVAGLVQRLGKSQYTGCPGGAFAPPGTGYSLGPGSGENGLVTIVLRAYNGSTLLETAVLKIHVSGW